MNKLKLVMKSMSIDFSKEMSYKANFIIKVVALMIADIISPLVTLLIYSNTSGIPGWNFEQFLLLQGIFIFIMGMMHFSQIAIAWETINEVREGTFDKYLLKPFKPLTYLSLTSWDSEGLGEVVVGLCLMAYSIAKLGISLLSLNFLVFLLMVSLGLVFTYSISVFIGALSFVVVKSFSLFVLFTSIMDMARYPSTIYDYGMRFFVTFIIPVSVASTMPALALIKGLGFWEIVMVALPVLFFFAFSLLFWNYAIKKYTSAGG